MLKSKMSNRRVTNLSDGEEFEYVTEIEYGSGEENEYVEENEHGSDEDDAIVDEKEYFSEPDDGMWDDDTDEEGGDFDAGDFSVSN